MWRERSKECKWMVDKVLSVVRLRAYSKFWNRWSRPSKRMRSTESARNARNDSESPPSELLQALAWQLSEKSYYILSWKVFEFLEDRFPVVIIPAALIMLSTRQIEQVATHAITQENRIAYPVCSEQPWQCLRDDDSQEKQRTWHVTWKSLMVDNRAIDPGASPPIKLGTLKRFPFSRFTSKRRTRPLRRLLY